MTLHFVLLSDVEWSLQPL